MTTPDRTTRPTPVIPPMNGRWRRTFPYRWEADDLVSRRELLHFAVFTSGALFLSTAVIAALGWLRRPEATAPQPIARVGDLAEGEVLYFRYPEPDDEAMLLHLPGGQFVAYSQKCTHLSCAVYYQRDERRLFCPCHDGVFDADTGDPTAGPPQRRLPRITLARQGDQLFAIGLTP